MNSRTTSELLLETDNHLADIPNINIALIAHDGKKPEMVSFVARNHAFLIIQLYTVLVPRGRKLRPKAKSRKATIRTLWW